MKNVTLADIADARERLHKANNLIALGVGILCVPVILSLILSGTELYENGAVVVGMIVFAALCLAAFCAVVVKYVKTARGFDVGRMQSVWINERLSEYIKSLGELSEKEAFRVDNCGHIVRITAQGHPEREEWDLSPLVKSGALTFDFEAIEWLQYYFYKQQSQSGRFHTATVYWDFDGDEFDELRLIVDGQLTAECLKSVKKMDKKTVALWN